MPYETEHPEKSFSFIDSMLGEVSRTFDFTLRKLPIVAQRPLVAKYGGYRFIDTVFDDLAIPHEEKTNTANEFLDCVRTSDIQRARNLEYQVSGLKVANPGYKKLIQNTSKIVNSFGMFENQIREHFVEYAGEMVQGFSDKRLQIISSIKQHHVYCYYAAAVVGRDATADLVQLRYISKDLEKKLCPEPGNWEVGINPTIDFGIALQLINDIRDLHDDTKNRIYRYPTDLLTANNLTYDQLNNPSTSELPRAYNVLETQLDDAKKYILSGVTWIDALPKEPYGLRESWTDALAFSAATCSKINTQKFFTDEEYRKIKREDVIAIDSKVTQIVMNKQSPKEFIKHLLDGKAANDYQAQ